MREPRLPPARRPAPRPLPLHLLTQVSTLMTSCAALPLWSSGSLPWKPHLAAAAAALKAELDAAGPEGEARFQAAVMAEAMLRHQRFLEAIDAYRRHPYRRRLPPVPAVWSEGTTRLLDYRADGVAPGLPVLVIPSLVNRAYILDLSARHSLMRYLAGKGLSPFLVDWDAPGEAERAFTLTDYVDGRLSRALDAVMAITGRTPAVAGYCMGGMLALALAQRRPQAVRALALLATPWDFHAGRPPAQIRLVQVMAEPLGRMIDLAGLMPVDLLQALFAALDPALAARKFAAFARLPRDSAGARNFVALEEWANDGVPLAAEVARECLAGWFGANDPLRGNWRIAGRPVRPQEITQPVLALVPARDRIVPPDSALPLVDAIPGVRVMRVKGGHVGMLLSARARTEVYGPLAKWLVRSAPQ